MTDAEITASLAPGQRSYTACNELRLTDVGSTVTIKGWVNRRRDHGGLIFLDVRDRYGMTQVVANPQESPDAHRVAEEVRSEFVLSVTGTVEERPAGTVNLTLETGQIELHATSIQILNPAKTPPFYIADDVQVDESLRLEYRYLDLRRPH